VWCVTFPASGLAASGKFEFQDTGAPMLKQPRYSAGTRRCTVITCVALSSALALAQTGPRPGAGSPPPRASRVQAADWPSYERDPEGTKYSPLSQINSKNVGSLKQAWRLELNEPQAGYQVTPLVVGGVMYISTPGERIVALEPETGTQMWEFDPHPARQGTNRGVTYWPGDAKTGPRVFLATADSRLVAVDARTGKPSASFGDNGEVNLRAGVAEKYPNLIFYSSSPPAIYKDLIILGPRTPESTPNAKGPAGDIRAFDTRTGKLVWSFHSLPRPGEPGYETWGPNYWKDGAGPSAWAPITIDVQHGLVFVPIGQPGGGAPPAERAGINLYANSVVALEADSGKMRWAYQVVHHDQWDFDVPAAPALIDVVRNGRTTPAVAQITKQGMLFILDRLTGKPIFGVEERPVPQPAAPDGTWPTQPFTLKPPPLSRNTMSPDEISHISPEAELYCSSAMKGQSLEPFARSAPSFPSSIGGGNWGGISFDPKLAFVFVNTSEMGRAPAGNIPDKPASNRFVDPSFYPCNAPPWGLLTAVNANTGDIAWKVPLGSYPELEAKGIHNAGTPNLGGSIVTAGGLLFIGATNDRRFRAFDSQTGKELWTQDMNGHAMATPMTFLGKNGKQYVVVSTGGPGLLSAVGPQGLRFPAAIVAFALP
jgi:quinoprotein glucose dehydrogenase